MTLTILLFFLFPFKNSQNKKIKKKSTNTENTTNFIAWILQIVVQSIIRTNLYIHLLCC